MDKDYDDDDLSLPPSEPDFFYSSSASSSLEKGTASVGRRMTPLAPSLTTIPASGSSNIINANTNGNDTQKFNKVSSNLARLTTHVDHSSVLPMYAKSSSSESSSQSTSANNSPDSSKFFTPLHFKKSASSSSSSSLISSLIDDAFRHNSVRRIYKRLISTPFLLFMLMVLTLVYFYGQRYSSRSLSLYIPHEEQVITHDPLIYPDLSAIFSTSKLGKNAVNRAPGDHAGRLNDPEMVPAAAKGSLNNNKDKDKDTSTSSTSSTSNTGSEGSDTDSTSISKQNLANLVFTPASPTTLNFANYAKANPSVVLVLGINPEKYRSDYLERLISNRKRYAQKFGFGLYVRLISDFKPIYQETASGSTSWAKLSILRAAIKSFPGSRHFWYLDQSAIITDFSRSIEEKLLNPANLKKIARRDVPIVPSFKTIRTYKFTSADSMRLIISQNDRGLNAASFILANNDGPNSNGKVQYSKVLLDFWNDPAYRSYHGFEERSEEAALNHLLVWHPTLLSRTGVVPPRMLAALSDLKGKKDANDEPLSKEEYLYNEGDTAMILAQCEKSSTIACMQELSENYI